MSALAMQLAGDRVVFAADTGAYDAASGVLLGFVSKLRYLPKLDAGFGFVGIGQFGPLLEAIISAESFKSFDELLDGLVPCMKLAQSIVEERYGSANRSTVLMAGYSSGANRFVAFKVHTKPKFEFEAWALHECEQYCSTNPGPQALEEFGIPTERNAVDLVARLVCACRSISGRNESWAAAGYDAFYAVGGALEIMTVGRASGAVHRVHEWADRIGSPIDPVRDKSLPLFPLKL
jgi:hypothetical protein